MKVFKVLTGAVMALGLVAMVAGNFGPKAVAQEPTLRIAFSVPGFVFPFFRITEAGALAEAERLGNIEIVSLDGRDDDAVQLSTAEDAVAAGIDGMVIAPRTAEGLASLFELLEREGIPVVTFDRRTEVGDILAHVGADNVAGGEEAGRFVAERLGGEGRIIELLGTPGASPAIDRSAGFNSVIDEHPGLEIVAQDTAYFSAADGLTVTEGILTRLAASPADPAFDALFAANDEMALGAVEAIRARGIDPGDVIIVGFDATEPALELIEEGALSATVDQFPNEQAATALSVLVEYIRDGTVPEDPDIFLVPQVISIDNLEEASTLLVDVD